MTKTAQGHNNQTTIGNACVTCPSKEVPHDRKYTKLQASVTLKLISILIGIGLSYASTSSYDSDKPILESEIQLSYRLPFLIAQAKPVFIEDSATGDSRQEENKVFYYDQSEEAEQRRRELKHAENNYTFAKDANDVLLGKGQFITQADYTQDLASYILPNKTVAPVPRMKVMHPTYYKGNMATVKANGFTVHNMTQKGIMNVTSGNTLEVHKDKDCFSTFDDGLLFEFALKKYEHLTYWCRTSTPELDTCNVKLFKLQEFNKNVVDKPQDC